MFGQGLMCTAHAQYIHNCSSALAMSISMSTKRRTSAVWEFFELTEVVDDAGKKHKKAICKLCEGVTLAYAGGKSNLFNHLEAKHPVAYMKAVPKECSTQKQTTLGTFATACPPAQANRITMLIAECVTRDSDATVCTSLNLKAVPIIRIFVCLGIRISGLINPTFIAALV